MANFLGETWRTGKSIVEGLGVTLRELVFETPVTVQYPEVTPEVPAWFRGIPLMKTDLTTGEYKCTSCGMCVEACPVDVITLEWHTDPATKKKVADRFAIDMSRCMLCNYCIEACPFDALVMGYDYELCKINPENMVYEFEDLLRLGLKYSKADEADGKVKPRLAARPPWVFHELTGSTEKDIMDPTGYLGRHPVDPKTRKQYVADIWAKHGPGGDPNAEPAAPATAHGAASSAASPAQAASHTITKDTPVHQPVVNERGPQQVTAAAESSRIVTPKAADAAPSEAQEVHPDQKEQSTQAKANGNAGGEGSTPS